MAPALIGLILFLLLPFVLGPLLALLRIHQERAAARQPPRGPDDARHAAASPQPRAPGALPPAA